MINVDTQHRLVINRAFLLSPRELKQHRGWWPCWSYLSKENTIIYLNFFCPTKPKWQPWRQIKTLYCIFLLTNINV